jgi:hypothetical protein
MRSLDKNEVQPDYLRTNKFAKEINKPEATIVQRV